jgi:hypothetical protein
MQCEGGRREGGRKPSSSVLLWGKMAWESEATTICRTGRQRKNIYMNKRKEWDRKN